MAIYAKKVYLKNTSGKQQTAEIYSKPEEAGPNYIYVTIDGSAGYIALAGTSDSNATSGRVKRSGTTYAIASTGIPPYTSKLLTTVEPGTFKVPSGVTKLRVTCVGGGAGGVVTYNSGGSFDKSAGLASTFGSITASGAGAAYFYRTSSTDSEGNVSYDITSVTPGSGTTAGYTSTRTSSVYDGAPAVPITNYQGTQVHTAGNGGHADGAGDALACGSSGHKTVSVITVTPGQSISYTVGDRGAGCRYGTYTYTDNYGNKGAHVSPGGVGAILVEWGRGIQ